MNSSDNMNGTLANLKARNAAQETYPLPLRSPEEVIFEIVVGCILMFLGITGNGLVCYVISQSRYTRSSMYFFLIQLAIADILVCSVSIPLTLVSTQPRPLLLLQSDISCKMVRFIQYLLPPASVSILTATAADRFLHICYPLRFLNGARKIKFLAICSWLYAAILTIPVLYLISARPVLLNNKVYQFCAIKETSRDEKLGSIYLTVRGILGLFIPLVIIIILYYKIVKTVWKRKTIRSRMRRNVIKSLTMVVVAFFLSWSPFSIISKYSILVEKRYDSVSRAEIITFWIGLTASVYNPLIYAFYNKNFRDAFSELVLHRNTTKKTFAFHPPEMSLRKLAITSRIPDIKTGTPISLKYAAKLT